MKSTAKMKTVEEIIKKASEGEGEKVNPMATFAMGIMATTAISIYEEQLDKLAGNINDLISALEKCNFTDENGTAMTDTLTFQNLKKRLGE